MNLGKTKDLTGHINYYDYEIIRSDKKFSQTLITKSFPGDTRVPTFFSLLYIVSPGLVETRVSERTLKSVLSSEGQRRN